MPQNRLGELICHDPKTHAAITEAGTFRDNPQAFAALSFTSSASTVRSTRTCFKLSEFRAWRQKQAQNPRRRPPPGAEGTKGNRAVRRGVPHHFWLL